MENRLTKELTEVGDRMKLADVKKDTLCGIFLDAASKRYSLLLFSIHYTDTVYFPNTQHIIDYTLYSA